MRLVNFIMAISCGCLCLVLASYGHPFIASFNGFACGLNTAVVVGPLLD